MFKFTQIYDTLSPYINYFSVDTNSYLFTYIKLTSDEQRS